MIKMAIFDVDSTLTAGINMPVVESAIEACKQLQEKGIKVVVASGRSPRSIPSIEGKIFPDYIIGANGAIVADKDKETMYINYLDRNTFERINRYCRKNKIGLFWKFEKDNLVYVDSPLMSVVSNSLSNFFYSEAKDGSLPTAGAIITSRKKMGIFARKFEKEVDTVDGGYVLFDIDNKGMNKALGLEKLCELLSIKKEECIAFGDSDNDIAMVKYAGIGVAMGNGYDSIKQVADYVTTDAKDDGIINALRHFGIL